MKEKKEILPIVESDKEDSELENHNEMDSKERKSNRRNKKMQIP